jgi:hypothetical protein
MAEFGIAGKSALRDFVIDCEREFRVVLVKDTVDVGITWIKSDFQLSKRIDSIANLVDFFA